MSQKAPTIVRVAGATAKKVEVAPKKVEKKEVVTAAVVSAEKAQLLTQPAPFQIQPLRCRAPNQPNCCEQPEDECKKKCGPCGQCKEKVKHPCKKGCPKDKDGEGSASDEESSEEQQGHELQVAKAFLTLDDAASPVDFFITGTNPPQVNQDLNGFLSTDTGIGYSVSADQFLCNFLVVGYLPAQNLIGEVGGPASGVGVAVPSSVVGFQLPVVQVFNTSCGCLSLVTQPIIGDVVVGSFKLPDTTTSPPPLATTFSVAISPSPERPWVAILVEQYDPTSGATVSAVIQLYALQQDGTLLFVNEFNLLTSLPNAVFANILQNISAENLIAFSSDGRYLEISFSQGSLTVPANGNTAIGILKIGADGTITLVATAPLPPTPPVLWLPQPSAGNNVFVKNPCRKNSYGILLVASSLGNTLSPTAPATAAIVTTWVFNPSSGQLVLTGDLQLPQAAIGYDLHPCLDRAILFLRETATSGPCSTGTPPNLSPISTQINPVQPFPDTLNTVPQPGSNLRLYAVDFNVFHNALKFLAGHYTGYRGSQVRFSHDGKLLAATGRAFASGISGDGLAVTPPGVLTVYTYNHNQDTIHLQDTKVTPPVPGSIAWNFSDTQLEVAGGPTPSQFAINLYSVSDNQ